ncbi:family 20 glycosylhydrolase [Bailinhaonella thermotolerans]|uniref:beta-N-acetylhexosaminidase n=1 Tax=Bailinhaonella thermotolerans TaxID=1070861 RepID=A0A3A4ANF6_9ACTN|nr:family 20 glycosylhydrolase [Bailinhaonella thermotolerans]RJL30079.1 hypothetical protein D5H75_24450 [Bailinhaonella thermotolerans]
MSENVPLVPLPQRVRAEGAGFRPHAPLRVAVPSEDLRRLGEVVAELIARLHGLDATVQVGDPEAGESADLVLALGTPEEAAGLAPAGGLDPLGGADGGPDARERHELTVTPAGARVIAAAPEGLFRGATAFAQLLRPAAPGVSGPAADAPGAAGTAEPGASRTGRAGFEAPGVRVADGPGLAWRGLSLDVVRRFFPVEQVERVIDLLALYRFNVLHLHLTDSQAWRLEIPGWPRLTDPAHWVEGTGNGDGPQHYTRADFRRIVEYAAERFVTVIPEIDMPGHTMAAVRAYPELGGDAAHPLLSYLDPREAAGFAGDVLREVAALTPGPYLHIGGDEAFGMPDEPYGEFVARALRIVRELGKRPVAWQEAARSGALGPGDVAQGWIAPDHRFDADELRARIPEEYHPLVDVVAESFARAPGDLPAAVAAGTPVLASTSAYLYLDRPYAEDSLLPEQTARRGAVGHESYEPRSTREMYGWHPSAVPGLPDGTRLAGVEAAIWCETVSGFADLAFLLLPRLPGVAEKAWNPEATPWEGYRARLAAHPAWWERLGWHDHYRSADLA